MLSSTMGECIHQRVCHVVVTCDPGSRLVNSWSSPTQRSPEEMVWLKPCIHEGALVYSLDVISMCAHSLNLVLFHGGVIPKTYYSILVFLKVEIS